MKQGNIKDLIKYIITEPEEDEYNTGHRFPFLACEILSRENLVLVDKIFENKHAKKVQAEEPIEADADSNSSGYNSNDSCKTKKEYRLKYVSKEQSKFLKFLFFIFF